MDKMPLTSEQQLLLHHLRQLQKGRYLNSHRLPERLSERTKLPTLTVFSVLKELRRLGLIEGSEPWGRTPSGRLWLTGQGQEAPSDFQRTLAALQLPTDQQQALELCESALQDWPLDDLPRLLDALLELRNALPTAYGMTRFAASARFLLGSAKLLDTLPKRALQLLGIDKNGFAAPASFVLAEGCSDPAQVLLIENPQSFNAALAADLQAHSVLICSFGHGLSIDNILADPERHRLFSQGNRLPSLSILLQHPNLLFWGDLDYEGLKIFHAIRKRCPQCRLSRLYQPMLAKLAQGHPLCKATGKQGQQSNAFLPHGMSGLDQEILQPSEIKAFSLGALPEHQTIHGLQWDGISFNHSDTSTPPR